MALFPRTFRPKYGYQSWHEENVSVNSARSGKIQVKDLWNRTRFMASMQFELRSNDALTVYGFWKKNRQLVFDFYDYDTDIYYGVNIGTGTGALTTFTIPANGTSLQNIYVNGVLKATPADYVISVGTGTLGQDRVVLGVAPANGLLVTADYVGYGVFSCRFSSRPEKETSGRARVSLKVAVLEDM